MNDIHDNEHEDQLPPIAGLKGLSMEREPEHDLWPAIQARIQAQAQTQRAQRLPPPRRRRVPLAAAASVTALIAGLIAVRQLQTPPPGALAAVAVVSEQPAAPPPQLAHADSSLHDGVQRVAMRAPSRDEMQGANRALIKANLKIVKSAESQLRQALASDPNDAYLQNLLLSTQSQKQHLSGLLDRQLI